MIGTDFYEVEAELPTAQAVVPGPGPDGEHRRRQGRRGRRGRARGRRAPSSTMKIKDKYKPIYRDATILLRPKTGLKDMFLALDPGTHGGRRARRRAAASPVANTLPDVNPDEILAPLDADTRAYLQILLNAGGDGVHATTRQPARSSARRRTCARRSSASSPPTATPRRSRASWSKRRSNIKPRDPQLPAARRPSSARKDSQLAALRRLRQRQLRGVRRSRRRTCARRSQLLPGDARRRPRPRSRNVGRAGRRSSARRSRRCARSRASSAPALRRHAPVPARDHADHPRPDPPVRARRRSRRCATCAPPTEDLAPVTPAPDAQLQGPQHASSTRSPTTRPATRRATCSGAPGRPTTARSLFTTQDAHGPIRRGIVLARLRRAYGDARAASSAATRSSGMLTRLANFPTERQVCPSNLTPAARRADEASAAARRRLR